MPNTNKPESMEEYDMVYNILRGLPIDVIRDFMWEIDYDWVINTPLRKEKDFFDSYNDMD